MIVEVEIPGATTRPTPNTRQSPLKTLMRKMPFLVILVSSLRRMLMILEMLSFHHNGKSFVLNLEVKGASGFGNLNVANTIVWLVQGRNSDRANSWILKNYYCHYKIRIAWTAVKWKLQPIKDVERTKVVVPGGFRLRKILVKQTRPRNKVWSSSFSFCFVLKYSGISRFVQNTECTFLWVIIRHACTKAICI